MSFDALIREYQNCTHCEDDICGIFFRCVTCAESVNLCIECFRHGVEVGNHKSAHKFRFMDAGGYVALQDDRMNGWTIMELHRLLMSVEKCQIGNWKDVSCSVRTRSSKSCEKLFSTLFTRQTFGRLCWEKAKKRWKSNFRSMRWNVLHKPPRKNPRLTSSQLQSLTYDKNRDEYECEALNDAEAWLTDAYSDPDGDKYFLALKALQVDLVAKNVFVRNRMRKAADKHDLGREFFGFGRLDYRPGCGTASSAGASEVSFVVRDAVKKEEWKMKKLFLPMAQFVSDVPFDVLWRNLLLEVELKERLREILFALFNGVKNGVELAEFQNMLYYAARDRALTSWEQSEESKYQQSDSGSDAKASDISGGADSVVIVRQGAADREPGLPGAHLLSKVELEFCTAMRMYATQYLSYKMVLIKDIMDTTKGLKVRSVIPAGLSKMEAQKMLQFFVEQGWISTVNDRGEMDLCDALDREDEGPMLVASARHPRDFAQLQLTAMMQSSESIESFRTTSSAGMLPDVASTQGFLPTSLSTEGASSLSVLLMDSEENLVLNENKFKKRTNIQGQVYVVCVIGNLGEGKSHILNHTFFGGKEVFRVFSNDGTGTEGVHVAFRPEDHLVLLDTEGLLNPRCTSQERQTRMLFKVLAVSDVVIFHSRAERLPCNLFSFLGDASNAYKIFLKAHRRQDQGPLVIITHQPSRVKPLQETCGPQGPEAHLRSTFQSMGYKLDSFSCLKYIGSTSDSIHAELLSYVLQKLKEPPARERRCREVVFKHLKTLNERFSGKIEPQWKTFSEEYLICDIRCKSCSSRCELTVGHSDQHSSSKSCEYKAQFENQVFWCKRCNRNGRRVEVVPKACSSHDSALIGFTKNLWSGDVLECRNCGVIHRSRKYWHGNPDPDEAVEMEIKHVWPGPSTVLQGTHNAARKVIDGVSYLSETVSTIGSGATSVFSQWIADQCNPSYWIPNAEIKECSACKKAFDSTGSNAAKGRKHHCRSCGQGFCADCSRWRRPVSERGWGSDAVRVCESCFKKPYKDMSTPETDVHVRQKIETVSSTLGTLTSLVLDLPIKYLKDTSRPLYWVPDAEITRCFVCQERFDELRTLHHCRSCGQGVCDECSNGRRPVPNRGWDHPVRVCNACFTGTT